MYQSKGLIAWTNCLSGDYRQSIIELKEVLAAAKKLSDEFPEDTRFQYDLWAFRRRIGIAYDKSGNFTQAIGNLEKSLSKIENLRKSSPPDAGYKRNASITRLALGQTYLNYRQPQKALAFLADAREASENLLESDGENGETIADLAAIYGALGAALTQTDEFTAGLSMQEKSLEFFNRSLAKSPANTEIKQNFAEILKKTAETCARLAERQNSENAATYREKEKIFLEQSRRITEK